MPKVSINPDAFESSWRLNTFIIYNCAVDLQIFSQNTHDLDPSEYLVFSVVACANMQRAVRRLSPSDLNAHEAILGDTGSVPISRRRIAEATGLPRETVRRIVQKLIRRGFLMEANGRQIIVPAGLIRGGDYDWNPRDVMGPILRMVQSLLATGAIQLSD